jgi:hypothetical protein
MYFNLYSLVNASSIPLLGNTTCLRNIQGFRIFKKLMLNNCSEIVNIVKMYLNYVKSLNNAKSKLIITPAIGIAPYIASLENSQILPNSVLIFVKRLRASNPFNYKLFLDDVDVCLENLKRLKNDISYIKLKYNAIFIYDPIIFSKTLIHFIPMMISFDLNELIHNVNVIGREISIHGIKFENFTILKYDENHEVLVLNFDELRNLYSKFKENFVINDFHIFQGCHPLLCINDINFDAYRYEFDDIGSFIKHLFRIGKGRRLYIEFWSSYTVLKKYQDNTRYYYLWLPYIKESIVKQLIEFIKSTDLIYSINRINIVSPFEFFSETGAIHKPRIWLSSLVEQILYKNTNIEVKLVI